MPTGRLAKFDFDRGFGFIEVSGAHDVFVHIKDLEAAGLGRPRVGDAYEFDMGSDARSGRSKAVNLRRAGVAGAATTGQALQSASGRG